MANLSNLNIGIGTDLGGLRSGLSKAQRQITSFSEGVEKRLGSLSTDRLQRGLTNLDTSAVPAASKLTRTLGKMQRPVANTTSAVINFNRVIQDAPFGIIGVANNLEPMIQSFNQLKASTGSTTGALKTLLTSAFTGPGALITAVSVASSLLLVFGSRMRGTKKEAEELSESMQTLNKSWERSIELQRQFGAFEADELGIDETLAQIREITEDIAEQEDRLKEVNRLEAERNALLLKNVEVGLNDQEEQTLATLNQQLERYESSEKLQLSINKLTERRQRLSEELINTSDALADSDTRQAQKSQEIAEQKQRQLELEKLIAEARAAQIVEAPEDQILDEDIIIPDVDLDLGEKIFPEGSLGALQGRLKTLQSSFQSAIPGTEAFASLQIGIQQTKQRINELQGDTEEFGSSSSQVSDAVTTAFQAMSNESIGSFQDLARVVSNTARKIIAAEIATGIATSVKKALTEVPFPLNIAAAAAAGAAAAGLFNAIVPKFHEGGIVPGPLGKERLILASGGETVMTPEQTRARSGARTIQIPVYLNNRQIALAQGEFNDTLSR